MCEVKISEIFSGETFSYQIPSGQIRRIGPFLHTLKQSAFDLNICTFFVEGSFSNYFIVFFRHSHAF